MSSDFFGIPLFGYGFVRFFDRNHSMMPAKYASPRSKICYTKFII